MLTSTGVPPQFGPFVGKKELNWLISMNFNLTWFVEKSIPLFEISTSTSYEAGIGVTAEFWTASKDGIMHFTHGTPSI